MAEEQLQAQLQQLLAENASLQNRLSQNEIDAKFRSKMQMFETFLSSIPKNRSEMVNELEILDMTASPYIWDPDDSLTTRSDSILTNITDENDARTLSTDSSIPLSRAMTDSEIDYGRFRRYKNRVFNDPWDQMRVALDAFPPGYLDSLNSFQNSEDIEVELPSSSYERRRRYDDELRLKMERFFDEECRVFLPDDPGLEALEDALREVDMKKIIDAELDIMPLY